MKTKLIIICLLITFMGFGQTTEMKVIQKKDSTTQIVKTTAPEKVADKIITLDSSNKVSKKVIAVQNDTIQAKVAQIKVIKETSTPTGNGKSIYMFIGLA